jgi:hypothetical protein
MYSTNDLLFLSADRPILTQAEGGFARRVFVGVLDEGQPAAARAFLGRVFEAAQLDLRRDALVADLAPGEPVSLLPAIKEKQAEFILVFGLTPAGCGLALEVAPYQPLRFYGANLLFADRISVLEPDKGKKGQLWMVMKQWFL